MGSVNQIRVNRDLCKKDGACIAVCPARFLAVDGDGFPAEVAGGRCILCGHCVAVCPHDAMEHVDLPREEFLPASKEIPSAAVMDGFLMNRRSVREFKQRPVSRETLESLLEVARRAPTASNSQKLHWIGVEGAAKVHALAVETMNGLRSFGIGAEMQAQWDGGYDFVLRGAPALVVACAPTEYGWGKQDCAIALSYMELAAEARGLGVCWAGYLTRVAELYAPLREALGVPEGFAVCGGLMLGKGTYKYRLIPPRKALSVQWN